MTAEEKLEEACVRGKVECNELSISLKKDFDILKKERVQLRRHFITAEEKLEEAFVKGKVKCNSFRLSILYASFLDKAARLLRNEDLVFASLLAVETDESIIMEEYNLSEQYRDRHTAIVCKWEQLNQKEKQEVSSKKESFLKHPNIVPCHFDGQLKNWISFWSVFKRIHENTEYDDGEKFHYLVMYTKEGSPAREIVESFPPIEENYPKAIARLKARCGREELLIEMYVRELISLVLLKSKGTATLSLSKLYDKLETQIQALEYLGVAGDKYTYLLTPLIESALPDQVLEEWDRYSKHQVQDDVPDDDTKAQLVQKINCKPKNKLQLLLAFLRDEVEREVRRMARVEFPNEASGDSKKVTSGLKGAVNEGVLETKPKVPLIPNAVASVIPYPRFCAYCSSRNHDTHECQYSCC